jgi:phospholipase/carboxylesterase
MYTASPRPHQGQPLFQAGASFSQARAAMVLLHGRGATAQSILWLEEELQQPDFVYVAPQAAGHSWYPYSFLQPIPMNEPFLTSALDTVGDVVHRLNDAGFPHERIMVLGFSQGGCLTVEYAARNARRYGGIVGLSGGLIGPEGTPRNYQGSLDGTPVFLGCSDVDAHIPKSRVLHTAEVLRLLEAHVTDRLYPNMGHTISDDEIGSVRDMMTDLLLSHTES